MRRLCLSVLVMLFVAVPGCSKRNPTPAVESYPYDMSCDSTQTNRQATLFCVRIDTRNGETHLLRLAKLPSTNGPTKTREKKSGSYKLVCRATSTPAKSDFSCIRLDRESGEVMVISLPKIPTLP